MAFQKDEVTLFTGQGLQGTARQGMSKMISDENANGNAKYPTYEYVGIVYEYLQYLFDYYDFVLFSL